LLAIIIQEEPTKVFSAAHAGNTKLALFGLGNIKDERLHRTFLNKKACGGFVRVGRGGATPDIPEQEGNCWLFMRVDRASKPRRP
jgi:hypothetical protein